MLASVWAAWLGWMARARSPMVGWVVDGMAEWAGGVRVEAQMVEVEERRIDSRRKAGYRTGRTEGRAWPWPWPLAGRSIAAHADGDTAHRQINRGETAGRYQSTILVCHDY